jgi:hypothetical protein
VRIEIPSARAGTSAHVRSRSACSSRHAARETRVRTRRSRRPASIRSLVQLNGLPGAAFDALLQRVVDLAEEPWDAAVPPGKDPAYGMTVFGAGYGLLTSHADDASEIIRIFEITWIG